MVRDYIDEVTSPLSASSSTWSMIELQSSREAPSKAAKRPSSTAKATKRKAVSRPQAALACLNCRVKKVKCRIERDASCVRCLKLNLQCSVPLEDERRLPCSKKVIRELQEKVRQLEEALRVAHAAIRYQAQNTPMPSIRIAESHWDGSKELTPSPETNPGPYYTEQQIQLTPPLTETSDEDERIRDERISEMLEMVNDRNVFLAEDFLYSGSGMECFGIVGS